MTALPSRVAWWKAPHKDVAGSYAKCADERSRSPAERNYRRNPRTDGETGEAFPGERSAEGAGGRGESKQKQRPQPRKRTDVLMEGESGRDD